MGPACSNQSNAEHSPYFTLAEANWQADARAFTALMRHILQVDGNDHTVIMIQVENEVGVLGGESLELEELEISVVLSIQRS